MRRPAALVSGELKSALLSAWTSYVMVFASVLSVQSSKVVLSDVTSPFVGVRSVGGVGGVASTVNALVAVAVCVFAALSVAVTLTVWPVSGSVVVIVPWNVPVCPAAVPPDVRVSGIGVASVVKSCAVMLAIPVVVSDACALIVMS